MPVVVEARLRQGAPLMPRHERDTGSVLVADVAGSTELAAKLAASPDGVDELSAVLNAGLAPVIDAIGAADGDILTFAGDGLTAFWPGGAGATRRAVSAADTARRAVAGGDPRVRIRFGVASGPVDLWNLGGAHGRWLCLASGPAVTEAAALQALVHVGEVAAGVTVAGTLGDGFEVTLRGGLSLVTAAPAMPPAAEAPPGGISDAIGTLVRPYLPDAVVARLGAGLDHYVSEVRTVTIMFVRVPGLTSSADLDRLQAATSMLQRFVSHYQSVVNRLSVDEQGTLVLILFGTPPHAHEDDAARALAAGCDLDRDLGEQGLRHGVGIATGPVFCGTLGTSGRRDYTVLGDAVNVAARLAGAALDDTRPTVLCDSRTRADAGRRWEFGIAASLRVKGKAELVTASTPRLRVAPSASFAAPMVGRAAELAQLEGMVSAVTPTGGGSVVMIVGEAGMGKSRLLTELRQRALAAGATVLTGHADPLVATTPYHAWRPMLRSLFEASCPDSAGLAGYLDRELGPAAPLLSAAVGVDLADPADTAALSSEARVVATRQAVMSLLARVVSRDGPLVLLLEDAHWFDSASWATLADVAELNGVVAVVTTRPLPELEAADRIHLLARPSTEVIHLEPLSTTEVVELARGRLRADAVGAGLRTLLMGRCGGNPFFTVEVLAALERTGSLLRRRNEVMLADGAQVAVPETIQVAITSRIDQLDVNQQLTLKVASVVGDQITVATVATIHPTARPADAIADDIAVLVAADFLATTTAPGVFEFKHMLIGESAYHLMLADQRRQLHQALARHYESTGDVRTMATVLALHWGRAADNERAAHYLRVAAVEAIANGMPRESVAHAVAAARALGFDLETDREVIAIRLPAELAEIERLLAGRRPADLETLPELLDDRVGVIIELFVDTMQAAHLSFQPELFTLMAVRSLNLTLRFGAGPYAPGVYAVYSIVLRGLGLDSRMALEFSELALRLDAATGGRLTPRVMFIHTWFQHHWHHPMAGGISFALAGVEAGLSGTDPLFSAYGLGTAISVAAASGHHLDALIVTAEQYCGRIGANSATATFHCKLEAQVAKALSGRTADLRSLTDQWCHEDELAAMAASDNANQAGYYHIAKCRLAYLADDSTAARAAAAAATVLLPAFAGQTAEIEWAVLVALVALADLPPAGPERGQRIADARARLAQLEQWAVHCPQNFAHKASLVSAELAFAGGARTVGAGLFADAIAAAACDGFPQWAGLAAQRWAHHTAGHDPPTAAALLGIAADHYRSWGAERLARMCDDHAGCLAGSARRSSTTLPETSGHSAASTTNGVVISS